MGLLDGKNILVTGGSRGIGAAIARKCATEGAKVAITYSSRPDGAEKVISELPGDGHFSLQLNISDEESVTAAFKTLFEKFESLDGLVNNAGITKDQILLRMKTSDFDDVIQTNLRGTFLCTKAVLKKMIKARKGSIVNITSVIGQTGNQGQANYAASKAGIEAFTKSTALELGSRNIRANCIAPGFIATDMTDALDDNVKKSILNNVPLQTLGDVEDIANASCFLLSDNSKYITGQTLSVNGGMNM